MSGTPMGTDHAVPESQMALADIYIRHNVQLKAHARYYLGTSEQVDDVLQEVFLAVLVRCQKDPEFRDPKHIFNAVKEKIRFVCLDLLTERRARISDVTDVERIAQPAIGPGGCPDGGNLERLYRQMLDGLPEGQRRVLEGYWEVGYNQAELAEKFEVNQSTISRVITGAKRRLVEMLAEAGE